MDGFQPYFMTIEQKDQRSAIEAIIFAAEEPISLEDLFNILFSREDYENLISTGEGTQNNISFKQFESAIHEQFHYNTESITELISDINKDLKSSGRPYQIVDFAGGWQFSTRPSYGSLVAAIYKPKQKKRISQAALETLAIIAYKQPLSKSGVEEIRGVNSNEVVNSLLEKELIRIVGRSEGLGKALLYGTTDEFLKLFGLNSLDDMPRLRELDEIALQHNAEQYKQEVLIKVGMDKDKNQSSMDESLNNY